MHSLAKRVPPATAWMTTCSYSWPSMPKEGWLLSEAEVNSIYTRTRAGRSIVIQENASFMSIFEFLTLQGVFIGVKTLRTRIIIINVFSGRKAPPVPHKSLRVPHKSLRNREDNCLQSNVSFCWCFALK